MVEDLRVLNELAIKYQALTASIRVDQYEVPLNLPDEARQTAAAYEAGASYQPSFAFPSVDPTALMELASFVRELDCSSSPWLQPMKVTLRFMMNTLADSVTHDPMAVTTRTTAMFGGLSRARLDRARDILNQPYTPTGEDPEFDAQEASAIVGQALDRVGLNDWTALVESRMNAMMDVSGERRELRIRQGTRLGRTAMARLLVHEVGCHVFRSASGSRQPIRLLGFGLGDYLTTEEGLACYQEEETGLDDPTDSRRLALRYLAAGLALERGFFDVYQELRRYSDHDQAFETTARAKRGISDTSQPGCHMKDKVYFEGIDLVSDHLKNNPDDLAVLYTGKISLGMLPLVKKALRQGGLIPAVFSPDLLPRLLQALPRH